MNGWSSVCSVGTTEEGVPSQASLIQKISVQKSLELHFFPPNSGILACTYILGRAPNLNKKFICT